MLETTTLRDGMILFTLSISSHGFAFGFFKRPHTCEDVFLTYKLMNNPLISHCLSCCRMLIYEYVDNGNLEQWLHGEVGLSSPLPWDIRMNIIVGTAKGYVLHCLIYRFLPWF